MTIIEEVYRNHPMTADLAVNFNKFGDWSLNILVVHCWKSTDYKAYVAGMGEINLELLRRFAKDRINMAFPTQTLYLRQDSEWRVSGATSHGPAR